MKIVHIEKTDSDMGLVLGGGKGVGEGNVIIEDVLPGKSFDRYVLCLYCCVHLY